MNDPPKMVHRSTESESSFENITSNNIRDFLDKNKSNHYDYALKNGRAGQRALDIPGTGPGRGTERIVYEPIMKYGKIVGVKIIEFITDHKY